MNWRPDSDGDASLFDRCGRRKYLTGKERWRFLAVAAEQDAATAAFARLLAYSGARISEALALTPTRIDVGTGRVVLRTLKRRRLVFRAVPVPRPLIDELLALARDKQPDEPLWGWCRVTAWRRVRSIMAASGIDGACATPRGLRHAFGIAAAQHAVPVNLLRNWMGHARLETTVIYMDVVGAEERAFAKRLWARPGAIPPED